MRVIANALALATFAAPLQLAYAFPAAAPPAGADQPSRRLPADAPGTLGTRMRPVGLTVVRGPAIGSADLWSLFDGSAGNGLDTGGAPVRIRIDLAEAAYVDAVGVFGAAEGVLGVSLADDGAAGDLLRAADLATGTRRWNRHQLKAAPPTRTITVAWQPARAQVLLRELEIWGRPVAGQSGAAAVVLPDALYAGVPAGAREMRAPQAEQTVALSTVAAGAAGGRFTVDVGRDPGVFDRVFLAYELTGLPHFTAALRSINGQRALGRFAASFGAQPKGAQQIEELAPGTLHAGENTIQFLPADDHNPTSYRVAHVRLVGIPARAEGLSDDGVRRWAALRDGREGTGWKALPRASGDWREWTFAAVTQPRMLDVRLPVRGAGTLTVSAAGTDARDGGKITVQLDGLAAGWHRIPLDSLPATDRLTLALAAGKEAAASLSELAVSGSPLPADEAPRLRVTYPLSGECVNHKVHVRGFVDPPAGAALSVNGARAGDVLSPEGAFAVDMSETAAGGGAGKPFAVRLEVTYPDGARASRDVVVGACVERPPVVVAANGRRRQPTEDLGAPYGVTITPASGGELIFAGARLEIPAGAVDKAVRVTVRPLPAPQVAPMDAGMTNITPGGQAFRFGPAGMVFKKPIRVTLPYDSHRMPRGYTEGEARTFYYDEALARWEQVGLIGQESGRLIAVSEHFTDFINATMAMPDHPGTQSFNPTSLKDIKVADPAAGIALIEPPVANSSGAANLRFPIELPPGRGGMQPGLAITYNSDSRNGWLGVGWDLALSSIQIDTRFGVPKYDGSESYLLDGQQITPIPTPSGAPAGGQYFGRRAEGAFDWIQRLGTGPTNFTWVVTSKSGVKSFYGETAAARLSDPTVTSGNIFRWALTRVRDPFGNEMKVTYQTDTGSNDAEPFTQIYPSLIDYTSNATTGLAAAYHVDLVRGGRTLGSACARPDAIIDGRPGFQEFTRCLLNRISVRLGTQVIRQYDLTYPPPAEASFQRALLSSIKMSGLNGTNALYQHDFTYFATPVAAETNGLDSLSLFNGPVPWAIMAKADGSPRGEDGVDHTHESSSTHSTHGGVGFAGLEAFDIGGSDTTSGQSTRWRMTDLNGDGLPDGVGDDGLLDAAGLVAGADRTSVGLFSGQFTPVQTTNFGGGSPGGFGGVLGGLFGTAPLASVNRDIINLHGGFAGIGTLSGNFDWTNTSREVRTLLDMDGDGYLDQVVGTSGGLSVRLNDGNNGFKAAQPWANYAISNKSCSLQNFIGNVTSLFADGVTRLIAPVSGVLSVAGDVAKATAGTGGKVVVTILKGVTSIFSFSGASSATTAPASDLTEVFKVVIDKNDPPCRPGPNNSCSGGLTIPVEAGDRIYMRISPLEAPGEAIAWDPQFTYTSVNSVPLDATQQNLREPDGSFIYKFSQSADFKPVGRTLVTWSADSSGTVAIAGQAVKGTTSDDVRIQIVQETPGGQQTVLASQSVAGNTASTTPMALSGVAVQPGDKLWFQVLSDLPIDPERVQWQPVVTYQSYCRFNPTSGSMVCGNVTCTTADPITCTMAGDPIPTFPVPNTILRQQVPVLYPLFRFQPGAPTRTFVTTTSGAAAITGNFVKTAATPARVVVAVQGVNRLFLKRVLQPNDVGTFPMAVTTPSLATGEQLFFTVYSDTDVSGAVAWGPVAEGAARPVNLRRRPDGSVADPSGSGIAEMMGGGFHGWSYGDWNGAKPLTESQLTFDPAAPTHDFFPMLLVPAPLPPATSPDVAQFPDLNPIHIVKEAAHLGGRVVGGLEDIGSGALDVFRSGVGKGLHLLGAFTNLVESLFCQTEHPIRITSSGNKGLEFGVGPANAGFNTGSSQSTVEMMDMNGDRYPDSVTAAGVRLNTGTQFAAAAGTTPLPYGDPRSSEHRNVHLGAGAGDLVTITNASGDSSGFIGGGVGLSYGVSATGVDLVDINGDGLPDHVKSDPATGGVLVHLNFGQRFGAEMRWSSTRWLVDPVSSQQDLVNRFGDDLKTNSLRVEDTSSNNGGLSVGGAGNGFGFGVSATKNDTMIRQLVDLIDVNGDGLPDQVLREPGLGCLGTATGSSGGCLRVKLNLGRGFGGEKQIPLTAWPSNASSGTPGGLADFGLGSPDALSYTIGGGSAGGFSATFQVYIFEFGGGDSWSSGDNYVSQAFEDVDGDGTLDHVLKANGNPQVFTRLNQTGKTNLLKQVKRPLGGSFDLDYSREGNKVDGTLLLDMPKNQWVLSRVTVHDGNGNHYSNSFDYSLQGPDVVGAARIGSGHYARDEREEYGYGHITTTRGIKQNNVIVNGDGSRLEQFFFNHDFYQKGLLRAEFEKNPGGGLMRGTLMTYAVPGTLPARTGRFFPAETQRVTAFYEGVSTTVGAALGAPFGLAPKYKLEKRTLYDADGNLKTFEDWGDEQSTADDVTYSITYLQEATTHITRATQIDAALRTAPGTLLRRRIATFDAGLGSIKTLTNVVTGGKVPATGAAYNGASSTFTYTHDSFGNLATFKDPTGYNLKYTYDTTAQTQLTQVDDLSFGYVSTTVPDLRFAAPTSTTDVNGQVESFTYDEFGRLLTVTGPSDQGSTPTIQMAYGQQSPASLPPLWGSTKHKDVQAAADPIETVTFVDGLRRLIQTKKDVVVDAAGNGALQTGMTVSGQVVFDSRGRVSQQGQPGFDTGAAHTLVAVPRAVPNFTVFAFDSLGRQRSQALPDGALTTTRYFVGPIGSDGLGDSKTWLMTETIDAIGNTPTTPAHDLNLGRRLAYADSRGNRVAVREYNNVGTATTLTALTTRYAYDPLDQLVTVTDAAGNVTTAVYDTIGQMVSLTSPDAGRTEYRFDLAGNLGAKETPVLRAQGKTIQYVYQFDRLAKIDEPNMPDVVYSYGGPAEKGNAVGNVAGRVKQVVSEGSTEQRTYDALGNLAKTVTTLPNMAQSTPATVSFTMKYTYDWLGRMQTMTFPNWIDNTLNILAGEGELVTYTYDRGGNLDKITGFIQTPNPQQTSSPRNFTYLQHIGYNEFEQRTVLTSGNGIANKFGYDALTRRLTDVSADSLGAQERQLGKPPTPFHRMHYDYDKVGNVTRLQNRVSLQPWRNAAVYVGPLDVSYTYDALYQLKTLTGKYRPNVAFGYQYSDAFVYDAIGNISKKSQSQDRLVYSNQSVTPTTDPVQAMAQLNGSTFDHNVDGLTYTLDYVYANGRPHATSTVNETLPNQGAMPRAVSYDAGGNNTGNTFRGTTRTQVWDEEDRLKQVTVSGGNAGKFRYNDAGERTKKQTAAGDAWYVNQYFVLLPNNLPTKHIFAGETRVASKTDSIFMQNPVVNFYHPDNLGSTSYTSVPNQDLTQHERYFAFGELWRPGSEQEECDLGRPDNLRREWAFTSKEWDPDSSLYYFGARYFDPHTAAWESPDPVLSGYMKQGAAGAFPANLGLYTYAWNNPVVLRDPNGLCVATGSSGQCDAAQVKLQQETNFDARLRSGIQEGIDKWGYDPVRAAIYGYLQASGVGTTARDVQNVLVSLIDPNVPGVHMSRSSAQFADLQLHLAGDAIFALTGGIAGEFGVGGSAAAGGETEIVQRAMSRAELAATRETGLLRGGRAGTHYVSDAVNSTAGRAQQRLGLPVRPEVRVTIEVPAGRFSPPTRVQPFETPGGGVLPGGGMERTATGAVPARVLRVDGL